MKLAKKKMRIRFYEWCRVLTFENTDTSLKILRTALLSFLLLS